MTLREAEPSRSQRARRSHHKQVERNKQRPALAALFLNDDHCVLSFREWCALNGISARTGRRILASGDGPVVTQLSARRIGITIGNNRRWQESRARGGQAA
jgi:hypothetical protein